MMKALRPFVLIVMLGLAAGCATCRPTASTPPPDQQAQSNSNADWSDWLLDQIVNNALGNLASWLF